MGCGVILECILPNENTVVSNPKTELNHLSEKCPTVCTHGRTRPIMHVYSIQDMGHHTKQAYSHSLISIVLYTSTQSMQASLKTRELLTSFVVANDLVTKEFIQSLYVCVRTCVCRGCEYRMKPSTGRQ